MAKLSTEHRQELREAIASCLTVVDAATAIGLYNMIRLHHPHLPIVTQHISSNCYYMPEVVNTIVPTGYEFEVDINKVQRSNSKCSMTVPKRLVRVDPTVSIWTLQRNRHIGEHIEQFCRHNLNHTRKHVVLKLFAALDLKGRDCFDTIMVRDFTHMRKTA